MGMKERGQGRTLAKASKALTSASNSAFSDDMIVVSIVGLFSYSVEVDDVRT